MSQHPSAAQGWAIPAAFTTLYISWGTTFLAIRWGVKDEALPPALFGGSRVGLAGFVLLVALALLGRPLRLSGADLRKIVLGGVLFFVGGNGLLTLAEVTVPSGVASLLASTSPLFVAIIAAAWYSDEQVSPSGWLGLMLGLAGVVCLVWPELSWQSAWSWDDLGPLYVLGSALSWAVGSLVLRGSRSQCPHLVLAGYQMLVGGGLLSLVGLACGEWADLPSTVTLGAVLSFLYLLVVGSLVGFLAFNYLLQHVSAAQVGTHAYVNPLVAVLVGWGLGGEEMTGWVVAGMLGILVGVAVVRRSRIAGPPVRSQTTDHHPSS